MTIRAVTIGIALALFISGFTYFIDAVIRGTRLIGDHLPISVFGFAMLLLLVINPLLRKRALGKSEIAVIIVLGLAVCGWPGSSYYRLVAPVVSSPLHMVRTQTSWQAHHVMSYIPDGSPMLAQGQVTDWRELAEAIANPDKNGVAGRIRKMLDSSHRQIFRQVAEEEQKPLPSQIDRMTRSLNRVVESPDFYQRKAFADVELNDAARSLLERGIPDLSSFDVQRLNRALLVSAFPSLILPRPEGKGVMLSMDKDGQEVLDALIMGRPGESGWSLTEIPWRVWRPNIVLWGGLALLLGMAALCLALIVHKQWDKHELLSYPIPRFVEEIGRREPDSLLPETARDKLFWTAFILVFGIRALNGCATWFPGIPEFPLAYDLTALQVLFPNARRAPFAAGAWNFFLVPTVIGFAYFLRSRDTFTLGIANYAWVFFASLFIARGIPVTHDPFGAGESQLLRFGAYLGIALMILYTGRRYYAKVAAGACGFSFAEKEIPRYAVWAGRGLAASLVITVVLLNKVAGLPAGWAALFILLALTVFLVMSRVICETGVFLLQPWWLPIGIITGLFGFEAIGPTPYIIMALASLIILGDPRTLLMPYLSSALRIGERSGLASPGRLAPGLIAMIVCGFIVAGAATMYFQHNHGLNSHDGWATITMPGRPFNRLSTHLAEAGAAGTITDTTSRSPLRRLSSFSPQQGAYEWVGLGLALTLLTAFACLRLPRWPIHPVLFVVWGTWSIRHFGSSFLIGWAIKSSVVKIGGTKGYHKVKPMMVGLIAGDLAAAVIWLIIGVLYYFITGAVPESYAILPP